MFKIARLPILSFLLVISVFHVACPMKPFGVKPFKTNPQTLTGYGSCVNSVCFNQNGTILASGSEDGTIQLWKKRDGQWDCVQTLTGHGNDVNTVCFNQNGTTLASGSEDKTIKLWNIVQLFKSPSQARSNFFDVRIICEA